MQETTLAHVRRVRETHDARIPALVHPGWASAFPWLVQGTTTRGAPGREFDLGLFSGGSPKQVVHKHWGRLLAVTAMTSAVHGPQVHGADVFVHASQGPGLHLVSASDGRVTREPGVLLAVSTADCVPLFLVEPEARAVALLHAGWRGVAAGVLERGLAVLAELVGTRAATLRLHLGPAICGSCYEVGPEVFEALGERCPREPEPVDLRAVLVHRALALGVELASITVSEHCTRCTGSGLFSHRGGDRGRQVSYLGIAPVSEARPARLHRAGLCGACRHHRVVLSQKGSRFYLCERSKTDSAYPRYPSLPVLECRGYEPGEAASADPERR